MKPDTRTLHSDSVETVIGTLEIATDEEKDLLLH
jgi:hypothetical protein